MRLLGISHCGQETDATSYSKKSSSSKGAFRKGIVGGTNTESAHVSPGFLWLCGQCAVHK